MLRFNTDSGTRAFNSADIHVLETVKDPELILYTWNHDPRTYAVGDEELQNHRLGLFDWIPRTHNSVMFAVMEGLNIASYIAAEDLDCTISTGDSIIAQFLSTLSSGMGQIAEYPFTQLSTNDTETVAYSLNHPDSRFLWMWSTETIEAIFTFIRTTAGEDFFMNQDPYVSAYL